MQAHALDQSSAFTSSSCRGRRAYQNATHTTFSSTYRQRCTPRQLSTWWCCVFVFAQIARGKARQGLGSPLRKQLHYPGQMDHMDVDTLAHLRFSLTSWWLKKAKFAKWTEEFRNPVSDHLNVGLLLRRQRNITFQLSAKADSSRFAGCTSGARRVQSL